MNYRDLLLKYIAWVRALQEKSYIRHEESGRPSMFSVPEWDELKILIAESRMLREAE